MEPMNEYEHDDGHDAGVDDAVHQGGALDDHFSPHGEDAPHVSPLPDDPALQLADSPELHFPGDEPAGEVGGGEWADDDTFSDWLRAEPAPEAPDDPAGDVEFRSQLEPPDGASGPPSAGELVEWTLRQGGA